MNPRDPTPGFLPAPLRLFLSVLAVVFLAEAAVMLLLPLLAEWGGDPFAAAFIYAALVTLIVAPLLWSVVVRPLRRAAVAEAARAADLLHLQGVALESAANAAVITDREGRITWVNPAFTRLTGYTPEEAIGQSMRLLKSGTHDQAFYRNLWETILSGQAWRGEIINRRKDGSLYTSEQCISPVRDERGEISHFVTIQQDISQRKRLEETLARRVRELEVLNRIGTAASSSLALNDVLDQALDATLAVLDMEAGEIFFLDEEKEEVVLTRHRGLGEAGFREISRFKLGEGFPGRVAQTGEPLLTTDLAQDLRFLRREVIAAGFRRLVSIPLKAYGRVVGTLDVATRRPDPFTEADLGLLITVGAVIGIAVANARLYEDLRLAAKCLEARVEDRTRDLQAANRKLEEALKQVEEASRHKSEFLSNMSHELRTPLNAVIGFSELLLGQGVGPLTEKQARYLGHIHNSGKHLLQLISDILDLSKVEAGKIVLQPERLPVAATLEDILVIARGLAKKGQIVEADIAPDLPSLQADPIRFKQICFNLLSNAVKFTPEGGRITVTARCVSGENRGTGESENRGAGDTGSGEGPSTPIPPFPDSPIHAERSFLELKVRDTGIGIKAADLPRLFQEFVQLETSATQRHEGTGLGLALTKRLVELHGGRIWAASEGEGRGSTFTVLLPFERPGAPTEALAGAPA